MQNTDADKTITTKEHRVDPTAVPLSSSDNKSQIQGSSETTVTSTLSVTSTPHLATSVETSVATSVATATTLLTTSVIRTTEIPTTVTQKTTTVTTTAPKVSTATSATTKQLVITTTAPGTAPTTPSVTIVTSTTPQATSAKAPLTTVSPATPVSGRATAPTTTTTTPQALTSVKSPTIQQAPTSVKVATTTSPTTRTITPQTVVLAKAPTTQEPVKPATSTTPITPQTQASPKAPIALATAPETQVPTKAPTTQATTLQISTQQHPQVAITTPTTSTPTTPVATSTSKIIITTTTPSKTATQTETTTSKETPITSKKLSAATKTSSKNISKSPTPSQESPKDTKAKTRSRLSTAIRKLSKTNKKKDSPTHKPVSVEESKTTEAPLPESKTAPTAVSGSTEQIAVESTKSTSIAVTAETKTTTEEDSKSKTKPRLTKRFILSSLRKSKTSAPKTNDPSQAETIASKQKQAKGPITKKVITTIEKSKQETKIATDDIVAAPPTDRVRKVEITISGKKIEQTTGNGKHLSISNTTAIASSPSETDYLTPLEDSPKELSTAIVHETSIASSTTTTSPSPSKKKKLKSTKSHSSDSNKTTTTTAKQTTTTTTSSTTQTLANIPAQIKSTEEKFVITQSIRDIPPSERAPAKPSRATPSSQTATTTGAVRKPSNTRSTATVVASRTIIQRLIKGSSASSSATNGKATKKKQQQQQQRTTTVAHSTQKVVETELMQTTQETLQRGHRFPTPSSPPSTLATVTTTSAPTTTATTSSSGKESPKQSSSPIASPNKTQCTPLSAVVADAVDVDAIAAAADTAKAHHSQRLIQLQLESNDSLSFSSSLPPTPPDEDPLSLKSNSSNEIIKSYTSYISEGREEEEERNSSAYSATETRSPQHRYTSSHTAIALSEPEAVQLIAEESVLTVSTIGVDELASSAESAQLSDYCGNKIKGSNKTGYIFSQQYSQDSQKIIQIPDISTASAPAPVHFAVGSAVRPPLTHFEQRSYDSNSSDSLSVVSEASRRRIHFLAQPTLSDEFESDELNRDLQKRFSEYSLESENDSIDKHMPAFGDLTMDQEVEPTIMTSSNTEKREHLYKILVIGELGTGKTSFIKRYVHQFFSQNYRATIGVDFALKVLNWDANTIVRLQLWDIAGQERFGNMTRVYYKEAVGAFIVFDVTRSGTFDCVSKWKEDLDSKVQLPDGSRIPCILLANKCDQEKQGIVTTPEKMDEYVRENGFVGWFETSAKENINIDEAAKALVNKILLNDKLITAADLADSDKFNLNNQGDQSGADSKTKCSC
ncbi:mucin-5AC isoform X1 [Teleopsis dalmanni]|uniref:mucin-5AC isoform X1 n=2 Tax=Teleopsis dalmanni TaxID=139649 RepID=UPI0018CE371C|nr:mucin-5AC isoform X1 [Teleopsis dalmanni]